MLSWDKWSVRHVHLLRAFEGALLICWAAQLAAWVLSWVFGQLSSLSHDFAIFGFSTFRSFLKLNSRRKDVKKNFSQSQSGNLKVLYCQPWSIAYDSATFKVHFWHSQQSNILFSPDFVRQILIDLEFRWTNPDNAKETLKSNRNFGWTRMDE